MEMLVGGWVDLGRFFSLSILSFSRPFEVLWEEKKREKKRIFVIIFFLFFIFLFFLGQDEFIINGKGKKTKTMF